MHKNTGPTIYPWGCKLYRRLSCWMPIRQVSHEPNTEDPLVKTFKPMHYLYIKWYTLLIIDLCIMTYLIVVFLYWAGSFSIRTPSLAINGTCYSCGHSGYIVIRRKIKQGGLSDILLVASIDFVYSLSSQISVAELGFVFDLVLIYGWLAISPKVGSSNQRLPKSHPVLFQGACRRLLQLRGGHLKNQRFSWSWMDMQFMVKQYIMQLDNIWY